MKKYLFGVAQFAIFALVVGLLASITPVGKSLAQTFTQPSAGGGGIISTTTPGTAFTFSGVNVTTATTALTGTNTARKVLLVQNNSTSVNMYVGVTSPVTATNAMTLLPGAAFFTTNNVPTDALYGMASAAAGVSAVVATGQ